MSRTKYSRQPGVSDSMAFNETTAGSRMARIGAVCVPLGLIMIAGAVVVPFFTGPGNPLGWYRYVYAAGALMLLMTRLFTPNRTSDLRLRRLVRVETWSAVFFCVAAVFMFYEPRQMRDWVAFTLAGAAIQIFTSLAIPARRRKVMARDLSFKSSKRPTSTDDNLDV